MRQRPEQRSKHHQKRVESGFKIWAKSRAENISCLVKIVSPQEIDNLLKGQNLPQAGRPYAAADLEKLMNVLSGHRPVAYAKLNLTTNKGEIQPTCRLG